MGASHAMRCFMCRFFKDKRHTHTHTHTHKHVHTIAIRRLHPTLCSGNVLASGKLPHTSSAWGLWGVNLSVIVVWIGYYYLLRYCKTTDPCEDVRGDGVGSGSRSYVGSAVELGSLPGGVVLCAKVSGRVFGLLCRNCTEIPGQERLEVRTTSSNRVAFPTRTLT